MLLKNSLCSRYQDCLVTSMKGIDFIFDSVQLMYYKFHKVNFKRDGLYIDSLDRIKKKKTTRNLKKRWWMFSISSNCYAKKLSGIQKESLNRFNISNNTRSFIFSKICTGYIQDCNQKIKISYKKLWYWILKFKGNRHVV